MGQQIAETGRVVVRLTLNQVEKRSLTLLTVNLCQKRQRL
jgi:hypothetical protein